MGCIVFYGTVHTKHQRKKSLSHSLSLGVNEVLHCIYFSQCSSFVFTHTLKLLFAFFRLTWVCRQLGFTGGRGHRNARYGQSTGPIWTSSLACTGLEPNLALCTSGETDWWTPQASCTHSQDAGVECDGQFVSYIKLNEFSFD